MQYLTIKKFMIINTNFYLDRKRNYSIKYIVNNFTSMFAKLMFASLMVSTKGRIFLGLGNCLMDSNRHIASHTLVGVNGYKGTCLDMYCCIMFNLWALQLNNQLQRNRLHY